MAEEIYLGNKNEKVGDVVSTKMTKTIVVQVTNRSSHPVACHYFGSDRPNRDF